MRVTPFRAAAAMAALGELAFRGEPVAQVIRTVDTPRRPTPDELEEYDRKWRERNAARLAQKELEREGDKRRMAKAEERRARRNAKRAALLKTV